MVIMAIKTIITVLILAALSSCATTGSISRGRIFDEEMSEIKESISDGNIDQAVRDLSMLLDISPKNEEARMLRATAYQKREFFDRAIHDYIILLEQNPANAKAHYNLGMIYAFQKNDRAASLKHLDEFLSLEPRHQKALSVAAVMKRIDGQNQDPTSSLETQQANMKKLFSQVSDPQRQKDVLFTSIKLRPDLGLAYLELGKILEQEGSPDEAAQKYEKAALLSPTLGEAHARLGQLLQKSGDKEAAEIHLLKASLFQASIN